MTAGDQVDSRQRMQKVPPLPLPLKPVSSTGTTSDPPAVPVDELRRQELSAYHVPAETDDGLAKLAVAATALSHRPSSSRSGSSTIPSAANFSRRSPKASTTVNDNAPSPVTNVMSELAGRSGVQPKKPEYVQCSLAIRYEEGDKPMSDLLRLEGGSGMPVIVESLAPGGKAELAGVKAGYALVAMNGRREFMQLPGWQVRLLLEAPVTLGFDPAPTKSLQTPKCTEIRLKRASDPLGIPSSTAVVGPWDHGVIADEVVFLPTAAPLWLSAWSDEHISETCPEVTPVTQQTRIYELSMDDAHKMVGSAMKDARGRHAPRRTTDTPGAGRHANSGLPSRSLSPPFPCSMDCVTECVGKDEFVGYDPGTAASPSTIRGTRGSRLMGSAQRVPLHSRTVREGVRSSKTLHEPSLQASFGGELRARAPLRTAVPLIASGPARGRTAAVAAPPDNDTFREGSPLRWLMPAVKKLFASVSPSNRTTTASEEGTGSKSSCRSPRKGSPKPRGLTGDVSVVEDPDCIAKGDQQNRSKLPKRVNLDEHPEVADAWPRAKSQYL